MLKAYFGEWNKENVSELTPHSLAELYELVDHLAVATTISEHGAGASGHHAWISVRDHGFDLEIYFGESTRRDAVIDFVLYGPYSPGENCNFYDGRGLHGEMTIECIKSLLALLDQDISPVSFVLESSLEVSVVTD